MQNSRDKLRAYRIGEENYPSVTSIISYVFGLPSSMLDWAAKNAVLRALREQRAALKVGKKLTQKELVALGLLERGKLLKESQLKGTTVHTWAEEFYNTGNKPAGFPKGYEGYWTAFEKFNAYFKLTSILQEEVVFSDKYKFAGRMDFYGTLADKKVLVDFKTSNFLNPNYGLQLAAYKHCLEEMGHVVDECYILHLRSGGFYEFVKFDDKLEDFLAVRRLFDWKKRRETPSFDLAWTPQQALEKLKT